MIETINDAKETEYQKLARQIGFEPTATIIIFRELTNFGDHRYFFKKIMDNNTNFIF
jgi:hypothetical protein